MEQILINITNENIDEVDGRQHHTIEEMSKERSNDSLYSKGPKLRNRGMLNTLNLATVQKQFAQIKNQEIVQKHDLM